MIDWLATCANKQHKYVLIDVWQRKRHVEIDIAAKQDMVAAYKPIRESWATALHAEALIC